VRYDELRHGWKCREVRCSDYGRASTIRAERDCDGSHGWHCLLDRHRAAIEHNGYRYGREYFYDGARVLSFSLAILLLGAPLYQAWAVGKYVAGWTVNNSAAITNGGTTTLTIAPTNGDNLHVCVGFAYTNTTDTVTLTDNATGGSNTYTSVDLATDAAGTFSGSDFYVDNIHGSPTTMTITAHTSGAGISFINVTAEDFSGEAPSGGLDGHVMQKQDFTNTTNNAVTSGNITTATGGDTIYGCVIDVDSFGLTAGTGALQDQNLLASYLTEYSIRGAGTAAAAATAVGTGRGSGGSNYITGVMAFPPATYGPLKQPAAMIWAPTAAPPGTATTSAQVMAGLSGSITPELTGNISIEAHGDAFSGVIGDGGILQLRYGTGATPVSLATAAGTAVGQPLSFKASTVAQRAPFTLNAIVTGLTVGTTYWLDIGQEAVTGSTASIENVTVNAAEF